MSIFKSKERNLSSDAECPRAENLDYDENT